MPTPRQILSGLKAYMVLLASRLVGGRARSRLPMIVETLNLVFMNIELLVAFTDMDRKFDRYNSEYGLYCPTSKACFLILYFYSIEPPLYYYLNKACRHMDATALPLLGPWAWALAAILAAA